jgi:hypothetical protein
MILERFAYAPVGTFGVILDTVPPIYTVERPWKHNAPYVSCIPEGEYEMRKRYFQRGNYDTWEIVGVPERTLILIHKANLPNEVKGCIGVGLRLGCLRGAWAVLESSMALDKLLSQLHDKQEEQLQITRVAHA